MLNSNTLKYLSMCKQMSSNNLFRNKDTNKLCSYKSLSHTHTHTHTYTQIWHKITHKG